MNYQCLIVFYGAKAIKDILINILKKKFANTYQFCDGDINKFCLMLRKGVYPQEYMDSWKKFDETSLPKKEDFYSKLSMEYFSECLYRRDLHQIEILGGN